MARGLQGCGSIVRAVIVLFLLCTMVPVMWCYMLASRTVNNIFTVGYNQSHIEEVFGDYTEFVKGKRYEKQVKVVNDGNVSCYVRVFAEMEEPYMSQNIAVDLDTNNWSDKQEDGYYYYKLSLMPGQSTTPLFTTLSASKDLDDFRMICYSETIQTEGWDDPIEAFKSGGESV